MPALSEVEGLEMTVYFYEYCVNLRYRSVMRSRKSKNSGKEMAADSAP